MKENLIERISTALGSEKTLEGFVRQLLEMLELVTEMESTYLTQIDADGSEQHVLYARNSHEMQIPEGLSVPWEDTLCKRALDEGRRYTCEVPDIWGDSDAAKALGITTYVSTPVVMGDGALYGTLCAASSRRKELSERAEQILQLFAELISQYLRKEQLLEELQEANATLTAVSFTDELTGLPNRRAVFARLNKLFAHARSDTHPLLMAFIDLDGFKQINDRHGHQIGDEFLQAVGQRLQDAIQDDDVLGRLGGDEFIIATVDTSDDKSAPAALKNRIAASLSGLYTLSGTRIDYAGASIGTVSVDPAISTPDSAVRDADAAMYQDKHRRRQSQGL